jgi:hypothetical protein
MKRRYGASPLHLLAHLAALALAGWALLQVLDLGNAQRVLLWLAGAVLVHDLLLWPGYTLVDRAARRGRPASAANYVRVPAGIAALLALAFFPVICGRGERNYTRVSGLDWTGYAERWLLVSAALFLLAGAVFLVRSRG